MAVAPSATANTATCPQCQGTGKERAVGVQGGNRVLLTTDCGVCGGSGILPLVAVSAPAPPGAAAAPPAPALELWPLLLLLGVFTLFFLWLWL